MSKDEAKKMAVKKIAARLTQEWQPSIEQFCESLLDGVASVQDATIEQVVTVLRAGPKDRQFTLDEVATMIEESHKEARFEMPDGVFVN